MFRMIRRNFWFILICSITIIACIVLLKEVFWPAWKNPINRTYTSKLGYANYLRKAKKPFPVKVDTVKFRTLIRHHMGEGLIGADSVMVPIIPLDHISSVLIQEGDRVTKGQILAELDETEIRYKVESANLAVSIAKAELERVKLGTNYLVAQERPEPDRIRLKAFEEQLKILSEQEKVFLNAVASGTLPPIELYDIQNKMALARKEVEEYRYKLKTSQSGQIQSLIVAESQLRDAELNAMSLQLRFSKYKIRAPSDGVVAQVLIHPGEFNQDSGKPAFVIASGMWFDCYVDQAAIAQIQPGDKAQLYLEALKGYLISGRVFKVVPIVSFASGGPEATRPITPKGSGSPEWPATFKVQIQIDEEYLDSLYHGLTGFARIEVSRKVLSVPNSAVSGVSAGHGIVHVINKDNQRSLKAIRVGMEDGGFREVLSGLSEGDTIITDGHQVLEDGDLFEISDSID